MKHLRTIALSTVSALTSATSATSATTPPGVAAFVRDHHLTVYTVALTDLNGDRQPEALVYAMATSDGEGKPDLCGSGGCELYVLALTPMGYRQVTDVSISRPPIRVLPTITHGWHDLGVVAVGGGITRGYEARLRFDGHSYPENPTVLPALRLKGTLGEQVIGEDADNMPKPAVKQ